MREDNVVTNLKPQNPLGQNRSLPLADLSAPAKGHLLERIHLLKTLPLRMQPFQTD